MLDPRNPTDTVPAGGTLSLAARIEWLIRHRWPQDAPPPRNNLETAAAIADATGEDISSTTIWKLRTGRQDNPQLKTLTALTRFFGVPLGYFGGDDEAAPLVDDLSRQAFADSAVPPEVVRALLALQPDARRVVHAMILAAARL